MNMPQHAVVLLVEDRDDDVLLVRRAFAAGSIPNPLFVVSNGKEAIDYLDGVGKFANRSEYPLPDLILLDLTLPQVTGFDVIRHIRSKPGLKGLRLIVLTSSERIADVNQAYDLGANSYLVKPQEFEDFKHMIRVLAAF